MRLSVISDIHIHGPADPCYVGLLQLIDSRGAGEILVLAGDVFDFLVGDRAPMAERYGDFYETLNAAVKRGVELHYIEGNHDFHLGRVFRKRVPKLKLHSSQVELTSAGKRFFIAHGDLVDKHDVGYLALRALFRSPMIKIVAHTLPGKLIERIGTKSSDLSQAMRPRTPQERGLEKLERTRRVFRNYSVEKIKAGYDFVIMGHCHDADEMSFRIGDREGQYMNVGYPRRHKTFVEYTEGDPKMVRRPFLMRSV